MAGYYEMIVRGDDRDLIPFITGFAAGCKLQGIYFAQEAGLRLKPLRDRIKHRGEVQHIICADKNIARLREAIKMAAIMSKDLFNYIGNNIEKARALDVSVLEEIISANAHLKAKVVSKDEKEADFRAILNFGHTVGHAVEAVSAFGLKHGQAVAIGMIAEAKISNRVGRMKESDVIRLREVINKAGLPTDIPALDIGEVMTAMRHDKKVTGNKIRFVLLNAIGDAYITDGVNPALVEEVLTGYG